MNEHEITTITKITKKIRKQNYGNYIDLYPYYILFIWIHIQFFFLYIIIYYILYYISYSYRTCPSCRSCCRIVHNSAPRAAQASAPRMEELFGWICEPFAPDFWQRRVVWGSLARIIYLLVVYCILLQNLSSENNLLIRLDNCTQLFGGTICFTTNCEIRNTIYDI